MEIENTVFIKNIAMIILHKHAISFVCHHLYKTSTQETETARKNPSISNDFSNNYPISQLKFIVLLQDSL